jgi:alanine racemase
MRSLFRKIRQAKFKYKPLITVYINKSALLHNLHIFQGLTECKIAPVLKSNAYGHGLVPVAKILDQENIPFLVVDSYFEALILRNESIKKPILIIGYTNLENILNSKLKHTAFTITDSEQLKELSMKLTKPTRFHLKFDTGMRRQGIILDEQKLTGRISEAELIKLIKSNKSLKIEGICSHLADAETDEQQLTSKQIELWNNIVKLFKQKFPQTKYYHLTATPGILFEQSSSEKIQANVTRLGTGLYGINPSSQNKLNLKPALSMKSIITSLRALQPGEPIGYGFAYQAKRQMTVATIPVGYYEGVDRRLSNRGQLQVNNQFCDILGRVSMNITSIDVTGVPNVKVGNEVVIISDKTEDKNSIVNMAKLCQTISYEISVKIPQKLRRIVI